MAKTTPADPFDYSRLYGEEKYKLENMELKSVCFPAQVDDDKVTSTWSDRVTSDDWRKAVALIGASSMNGDAYFAGVSDSDALKFGQSIADAIKFAHPVTGVRVVRHTNWSNGYPCLRIDLVSGGKGRCGTTKPKSSRFSMDRYGNIT